LIDTEDGCAQWTFSAEPGAVRKARHVVHETLSGWTIPHTTHDLAILLVSELMTNALLYASGPIGLRMALLPVVPRAAGPEACTATVGAALLVEVSDPVPDAPTRRQAGPEDEGGRGLQLVACSALRWGTRRGGAGKTVWFELPLRGEKN